jgi:hypothetical protein
MKRPAVILSAALAATVIAGILTTSGAAQVPGERTFKIIEGSGGTFKFIDNAPKARTIATRGSRSATPTSSVVRSSTRPTTGLGSSRSLAS